MLNSSFVLLFHSRHWTRTTCCQTKDPTSTRRRYSRPTSTQPPTIPRHSASLTTNPTPPPHHAEPTTTVTTAETQPADDHPLPLSRCLPSAPNGRRYHGDISEPMRTEMLFRAWQRFCALRRHLPEPVVSSAWWRLCFKGCFWNFPSRDVDSDYKSPAPGEVKNLCNQSGGRVFL